MATGVISGPSAANTDFDKFIELGSFLSVDANVKKAASDLAMRQKAAEEAEVKANAAIKQAASDRKDADAKLEDLTAREAALKSAQTEFSKQQSSFMDYRNSESERLKSLSDSLITQKSAQDMQYKVSMAELEKSFSDREKGISARTTEVETLAAGLVERENAVKAGEEQNKALRERLNARLAQLQGLGEV